MYFGDSVTLTKWRDSWLAEGFAEFSSWMWSEHSGEALRVKLGDAAFFDVPRSWHAAHLHGNATERGFRTFAEQRTGVELTHFFDVWLVDEAKPTGW